MATEVKIPAMGESISSGILAQWLVKDGDHVEKDQPIYELETDKITSEANAEVAGKISIKVEADEEVEIGQVVAEIDESASAGGGGESERESESEGKGKGKGKGESKDDGKDETGSKDRSDSSDTEETKDEPSPDQVANGRQPDAHHALSPAARKAAEETGVDVTAIEGSGKDGRVTKDDILKAAESKKSEDGGPASEEKSSSPSAPSASRSAHGDRETRKKMSPLRRKIAERLVAASQEAAMLTTFNEVDMSTVMDLRKKHQEKFVEKHGIKLGFMSFFAKAVVHALQKVPQVNARIEGNEVVTQHYYDIGVAVGTDKGLMVPVIRDCDSKGFARIEQDIGDYAKAARDGKIQMSDLEGGIFTISNGGIYGSMLSTPIINHPQPAILGLHNIRQRPVVVDGEIVARPMMYLALSYDHRLIDGKEAVTFLVAVKEAIEDPSRLLFGI